MLFKKLSTVERVYNIGLQHNNLKFLFRSITEVVLEAENDLEKLYDLKVLDKIPVKDIMTKNIITINENKHYSELVKLIDEHRHMGYPVVNDSGELVGVVTFSDLKNAKGLIKDIMTPKDKLLTTTPDTSASDAQNIMANNDIGRLLVIENGKLIGLVSRGDIVKTNKTYGKKTKIQKCDRLTILHFYDEEKYDKLQKLSEDLIMLLGGRGYNVSEKEEYIEILTDDWEPLAKIVYNNGKPDHISITTKTIDITYVDIICEIFETIEKYNIEEIVITDHIRLIDEKSSIQRIITDMTSFKDSEKTFGTITIRSDF